MNHKMIEEHLANAVEAITPNVFEKVSSAVLTQSESPNVEVADICKKRPKLIKMAAGLAAACIVCVMMIAGSMIYNNRVDSIIYIDINPSIEIKINRENEILGVSALNADADQIISGMDLNKSDLGTTVDKLIESMVENGYINETYNSILLSVSNKNDQRAGEINTSLSLEISDYLEKNNINATVYYQQVAITKELEKLASQYGISVGKAEFIMKLIDRDSEFDINQLSVMKIQEIVNLANSRNIDLHEITTFDEDKKEQKNSTELKQDINSTYANDKNVTSEDTTKDVINEDNKTEDNDKNESNDTIKEDSETENNNESDTEDVTDENKSTEVEEEDNSNNDNESSDNTESKNDSTESETTKGNSTESETTKGNSTESETTEVDSTEADHTETEVENDSEEVNSNDTQGESTEDKGTEVQSSDNSEED